MSVPVGRPLPPREWYADAVRRGELVADVHQEAAVASLQDLYEALVAPTARAGGVLAGLRSLIGDGRPAPPRGIYLWGGVGRGKTYMVNAFHDALPIEDKLRIHFHSFMQYVHDELKRIGQREDPLELVAAELARETRVVCFDEFQVTDIADAMLLGRLLGALFERGVTLVATSNTAPDDLYRDGLQRARFLPAIETLKRYTDVVHLASPVDYRLRALERAEIYHSPLDGQAEVSLASSFASLAPGETAAGRALDIAGRAVEARRVGDGVVWFDFAALCETARSASDYVEVARRYHTVLVAGVPLMDDAGRDRVVRFVNLVDALYDRNVNLIVSAAGPPRALYRGEQLADRFARTRSRLEEMQSREYLGRKHLP